MGEFEQNVVSHILVAVLAVAGKIVFDRYSIYSTKKKENDARKEVYLLIKGVFARLRRDAQDDWLAPWGLYYKDYLADEILHIASDNKKYLASETLYDILRTCSAMKKFSLISSADDSGVYTADELVCEVGVLLYNLADAAFKNPQDAFSEKKNIEEWLKSQGYATVENNEARMRHPGGYSPV